VASPAARRLTEAHRMAQLRLGAQTVTLMRAVWRILNPDALDRTFDAWITAAVPIIERQRIGSARIAANYLRTFRQIETGAPGSPVIAAELNRSTVATSLLVTGPISVKNAMDRGVPLARAMVTAEARSSAAAMRHALDGGRDTIISTLQEDPEGRGWQRVASGGACKFCSMLDGKFHYAETADFPAHDGCSCSQEPVFGERRVSELSLAARQ
jgi:hypothetical protein